MSPAIKELKRIALEAKERKYPRPPYLVTPKFTDKNANGLTKCVIRFLQLKGHQAERISCTGRRIDRTEVVTDCLGHRKRIGSIQWIASSMTKGTADISATINGKSVKIEIKVGRDRIRPDQEKYKNQVEQAGGIYLIASSFEQFYNWYLENYG